MDEDVTELVEDMDELLSFVDNVDILKEKLKHFLDTIERILRTIEECCEFIRAYLERNTIGTTFNSSAVFPSFEAAAQVRRGTLLNNQAS